MFQVILFSLIGFTLIVVDVVLVPGAFLFILGCVFILYSIYLNFQAFGIGAAALHFLFCMMVIPTFVFWFIKRYALKGEMSADEGYVGLPQHDRYIGRVGTAWSDLRPSGTVALVTEEDDQLLLDCVADGGFIEKGQKVQIVEERGPSLIVRLCE